MKGRISSVCLVFLIVSLVLQPAIFVPSVKANPTYEDFTTYTEVDPNSHLDKTANHVDHKGYRNEDCYLYKDKGAAHFGDFTHLVDLKAYPAGGTSYGCSLIWMLSKDTVDDMQGLINAGKTAFGIGIYGAATTLFLQVEEAYGGTRYISTSLSLTLGTQYYLTIIKSGTTLTCNVYTDAARTNLFGTRSLTLHADHTCQYIFAGNTRNDGTDSGRYVDVDIDNLDLQEEEGEEYSRSASQSITLGLSASKLFEITRPATQTISIGLTATRLFDITRLASLTVTFNFATSRIADFFRTASQTITFTLQGIGEKIALYFRNAVLTITTSLTSTRLTEVTRQAVQTLNFIFNGERLLDITRTIRLTIKFVLEGFGSIGKEFERVASLTLTFTSGIMGIFGESTSLIFALAALAIILALVALALVVTKKG